MTSSMYPLDVILATESVNSIVIDDPGTGYTSPTVTIDAPSSGVTATGDAVIGASGVINAIILTGGTNYADGEAITIAAGAASTTTAAGTAVISGGIIQSISFTNRGIGYLATDDALTVTGVTSGETSGSIDVDTIASTALSSITITNAGSGYTSVPNIVISEAQGGIATAVLSISVDGNILSSDITITRDMVKPGGGGILRVYFSLIFDSTPATVAVFNNGTFKGNLNADNDAQVITDGYYRFDIDVEEDDNINFQCSTDTVLTVNFFRAHLVQFGA